MARIPDTNEELVRAARFQLGLDPPPDLEEAIQKTAHIPDEQLRPVLLKLVTDAVERKEPGTMAQKNAVVAHVLCTLHPQIPELVMLKTMNWLRPGRKHKSRGIVNAVVSGPNGSRIFCKEDEPDPPPEISAVATTQSARSRMGMLAKRTSIGRQNFWTMTALAPRPSASSIGSATAFGLAPDGPAPAFSLYRASLAFDTF